jgi:glycosyltransferase involved in cell wall biosynthesis
MCRFSNPLAAPWPRRPMIAERPLHVNMMTGFFYPDLSGTGQVLTDLALGLRQRGCDVTVYTTHPTFGSRKRAKRRETLHGVRIHRLFGTQFDKNHKVGRAINSATFLMSALWTLLTLRTPGPILLGSHPPLLEFICYLATRVRRRRYILLVHDVFPEIAIVLGLLEPRGLVRRIWDAANRASLTHAARIIVLSESMKANIVRKVGGAAVASRIHVIHNWADEDFIRPLAKAENRFAEEHGLRDTFVVLYSGNLGRSHNLETIIGAAERLRDRRMVFLFIGDGAKKQKLQARVAELGLHNVRFLPYQPRETLPRSLTCADVSLVALEKGIEGLQMPSKIYSTLASGRPIVALVEPGYEIARIIASAGCGRSVAPNDVAGLANILDHYYTNREAAARAGRMGRLFFETHFTRDRTIRAYDELLRCVDANVPWAAVPEMTDPRTASLENPSWVDVPKQLP